MKELLFFVKIKEKMLKKFLEGLERKKNLKITIFLVWGSVIML